MSKELAIMILRSSFMYNSNKANFETVDSAGKALTTLGFIITGADATATAFRVDRWGKLLYLVPETFMCARSAFAAMGAKEDARRADEFAKTAHKILVGEDSTYDGSLRA
ncbi:hypothetical protein BT63DRAFT_428016 [Microthyrium microscopicum]|uniref:Uncharacterized protein n=1 Tax=Microthyrium microscopicum TaxID=703497 RepID=A0A6A6U1S1_9PEZI|nr:hypothetical protein BT63DRAFT_428016 [Microthyrium microscopicum]